MCVRVCVCVWQVTDLLTGLIKASLPLLHSVVLLLPQTFKFHFLDSFTKNIGSNQQGGTKGQSYSVPSESPEKKGNVRYFIMVKAVRNIALFFHIDFWNVSSRQVTNAWASAHLLFLRNAPTAVWYRRTPEGTLLKRQESFYQICNEKFIIKYNAHCIAQQKRACFPYCRTPTQSDVTVTDVRIKWLGYFQKGTFIRENTWDGQYGSRDYRLLKRLEKASESSEWLYIIYLLVRAPVLSADNICLLKERLPEKFRTEVSGPLFGILVQVLKEDSSSHLWCETV